MNLTARELEVLRLLATGLTYKEVATELGLAFSTVASITENARLRLGAHTTIQAFVKLGWLIPPKEDQ